MANIRGPEGLGPIHGWPFYPILTELNRKPSMKGAALGTLVLRKYADKYRESGGNVKLTIALCSLRYSNELMKAMQALVRSLRKGLEDASNPLRDCKCRLRCQLSAFRPISISITCAAKLKREPSVHTNFSSLQCMQPELKGPEREICGEGSPETRKDRRLRAPQSISKMANWRERACLQMEKLPWTDPMATQAHCGRRRQDLKRIYRP